MKLIIITVIPKIIIIKQIIITITIVIPLIINNTQAFSLLHLLHRIQASLTIISLILNLYPRQMILHTLFPSPLSMSKALPATPLNLMLSLMTSSAKNFQLSPFKKLILMNKRLIFYLKTDAPLVLTHFPTELTGISTLGTVTQEQASSSNPLFLLTFKRLHITKADILPWTCTYQPGN